MRSFCTAFIVILLGLNLACSSVEERPANQKSAANRPQNAGDPAAANTSAPAINGTTATGGENPANRITPADQRSSKMEAMRREAETMPPPKIDIEAELRKSTIAAPENSEYGAVLADIVFERRTFKSHPQLLKIEKITRDDAKTIQVFLKDGSVVDVPGERIPFISKATSGEILKAAETTAPTDARRTNSKTM